jgi:peptidoglycan/xylan/chitin deacetylase (PgdA/CDA1 family)
MSLDRTVDLIAEGRRLSREVAVVTLDDGYRSNYEQALPILQELGCPATVFVIVEPVGTGGVPWPQRLHAVIHQAMASELCLPSTPGEGAAHVVRRFDLRSPQDRDAARKALKVLAGALDNPDREAFIAYVAGAVVPRSDVRVGGEVAMLSWEQVRELDRRGVTIGSHTMTHPRLGCLDAASVAREVVESRRALEAALGHDVRLFAYPFGRWADISAEAKRAVIAAGYRAACTTVDGPAGPDPDLFALRRLKVRDEPVWRFALRLVAAGQASGLLAWILDEDRP